jgi:VanZ family protein
MPGGLFDTEEFLRTYARRSLIMNKVKLLLPVILYCALIFSLSSLSTLPDVASRFPDKIAHLILYAGLGFLAARAISASFNVKTGLIWTLTTTFCLVYGISDEIHQYFVPGRTAEIADAAADMIGGFAGAVLYTRVAGSPNVSTD